jgi:DNA-binding HxlR family transcriptional regulator
MRASTKSVKLPPDCKRSVCGVACSLDLLGDKWTLLVVRDLLLGKHTYGELQASPEGVPTNILADRLKRLQAEGMVYKTVYQERPRRYAYHLTDKGSDLMPVLRSMVQWANQHVPGTLPLATVEKRIRQKRASCKSPS